MIDVISPDRSIVRVHLKPYIESDGDREDLLQAFIQTANYFIGSTDLLREYWWDIEGLAKEVEIQLQIEGGQRELKKEAISALQVLGFERKRVEKTIDRMLKKLPEEISIEELIKSVLKNM